VAYSSARRRAARVWGQVASGETPIRGPVKVHRKSALGRR
jgi:hypothetical protein